MHFMSVPEELSGEVRAHSMLVRRGFGSVRVEVTHRRNDLADFGSSREGAGGYFLPVKMEVLRKTGIAAGDEVTVELELLES